MRKHINSHVVDTSFLSHSAQRWREGVDHRHADPWTSAQREDVVAPTSFGANVALTCQTVAAEVLLGPLCPPPFQRKKIKKVKGNNCLPGIFSTTSAWIQQINTENSNHEKALKHQATSAVVVVRGRRGGGGSRHAMHHSLVNGTYAACLGLAHFIDRCGEINSGKLLVSMIDSIHTGPFIPHAVQGGKLMLTSVSPPEFIQISFLFFFFAPPLPPLIVTPPIPDDPSWLREVYIPNSLCYHRQGATKHLHV